MHAWEAQVFDSLLGGSVLRFFERLRAGFGSEEVALERLAAPDEEVERLAERFAEALFAEVALDSSAGSCFVLEALEERRVRLPEFEGNVAGLLAGVARRAFAELLIAKTSEAAQLSLAYGFEGADL
ncbi:MAG: hypothetical protein M0Z91_04500 [Actinomycetota bacterium]|jgi:hypothetical protein|nr:hypothetical protein [Actinomycetota bacterium]